MTAERVPGEVLLAVTDTGAGIPLQDQKRVFGKFERGSTKSERHVGVGLGLSLVKSLIELHGGQVELHSTSGSGTQVVCRLPDLAEPLDADAGRAFADVPNLLLTPHVAGVTEESNRRVSRVTAENVARCLRDTRAC